MVSNYAPLPVLARNRTRFKGGIASLAVVSLVIFILTKLTLSDPGEWSDLNRVSGILLGVIGAILICYLLFKERSPFDNPIYLAVFGYIAFVGVGPALASYCHCRVSRTTMDTFWCVWAGFISMLAGYGLFRRRLTSRRATGHLAEGAPPATPHLPTLKLIALFLGTVGFIGIGMYIYNAGGLRAAIAAPYGTRYIPEFYLDAMLSMLKPATFLFVGIILWSKPVRTWQYAAALALVAVTLLWFGPIAGSRRHIISLIVTFLLLANYARSQPGTQRLFKAARLLLAIGAILFILLSGGFRTYSPEELLGQRDPNLNVTSSVWNGVVDTLYLPYYVFSTIVDRVPRAMPYMRGGSFYESATIIIPRIWWKSKPVSISTRLVYEAFNTGAEGFNTVATWPGELYLNFGMTGVSIGMFLTGALCGLWAGRRRARIGCGYFSEHDLMYAVALPVVFQLMWGGTNSFVWHFWYHIVPVWIALLMARSMGHFRTFQPTRQPISRLPPRWRSFDPDGAPLN